MLIIIFGLPWGPYSKSKSFNLFKRPKMAMDPNLEAGSSWILRNFEGKNSWSCAVKTKIQNRMNNVWAMIYTYQFLLRSPTIWASLSRSEQLIWLRRSKTLMWSNISHWFLIYFKDIFIKKFQTVERDLWTSIALFCIIQTVQSLQKL